jgi:hypothetical protein
MDARLAVLRQVESFRAASGLVITTAEHQFVAAWRAGQVNVPDAVRTEIGPNLSASSLQRWRLALQKGGISRLGGDYGNRKGASKVDEAPGGYLSDYVPFYLTPHSPMLFNIKTGYNGIRKRSNDEIVILVSSLPTLAVKGVPFLFTDRPPTSPRQGFPAILTTWD